MWRKNYTSEVMPNYIYTPVEGCSNCLIKRQRHTPKDLVTPGSRTIRPCHAIVITTIVPRTAAQGYICQLTLSFIGFTLFKTNSSVKPNDEEISVNNPQLIPLDIETTNQYMYW